jgi:hypothetical protein
MSLLCARALHVLITEGRGGLRYTPLRPFQQIYIYENQHWRSVYTPNIFVSFLSHILSVLYMGLNVIRPGHHLQRDPSAGCIHHQCFVVLGDKGHFVAPAVRA